jgi:hypothetical protein
MMCSRVALRNVPFAGFRTGGCGRKIQCRQTHDPYADGFRQRHCRDHTPIGKQPGDQTHYGDGALVLLESIAQVGHFDARAFGLRFLEAFEPGLYQGYVDQSTKGTIANYRTFTEAHRADEFDFQKGADDDHLGTASRRAALVVRHHADPHLLNRVESLTRVCQDNPRTVAYMKAHALLFPREWRDRLTPRKRIAAAVDRVIEAARADSSRSAGW